MIQQKLMHDEGGWRILMNKHVQRVAHRGGSHLAPENTLAAFRNALTLPIDAIELDVHMSRDGHTIVFHDYTVDGRTNGHGNILDLDFAYLRSLNAAAHFPGGWPEPQQITTLGCNWINMDRKLFTDDMPAAAHEHDFKLGLWTVNTVDEMRRFAAAGVDSLTSDRPDLFSAITI